MANLTQGKQGIYIAFEGIDGCGKTTQISKIKDKLNKLNMKQSIVTTKDLSDGPIGDMVRSVFLSGVEGCDPLAMSYLYAADRINNIININSYLAAGSIVISDRSYLSAYAYDNYHSITEYDPTRPTVRSKIHTAIIKSMAINDQVRMKCMPDVIFYIDCPADIAIKRIKQRSTTNDIYENKDKLDAIRQTYRLGIEIEREQIKHPKIFILDGTANQRDLTNLIMTHIEYELKERHII